MIDPENTRHHQTQNEDQLRLGYSRFPGLRAICLFFVVVVVVVVVVGEQGRRCACQVGAGAVTSGAACLFLFV